MVSWCRSSRPLPSVRQLEASALRETLTAFSLPVESSSFAFRSLSNCTTGWYWNTGPTPGTAAMSAATFARISGSGIFIPRPPQRCAAPLSRYVRAMPGALSALHSCIRSCEAGVADGRRDLQLQDPWRFVLQLLKGALEHERALGATLGDGTRDGEGDARRLLLVLHS